MRVIVCVCVCHISFYYYFIRMSTFLSINWTLSSRRKKKWYSSQSSNQKPSSLTTFPKGPFTIVLTLTCFHSPCGSSEFQIQFFMSLSSLGAVSRSALISTNFVWNQFKSSLFPPAPFVPEVALWPRERPWCLWTRARPEWTSRAGLSALLLCPGVLEDLLGELFCLFYGLLVALRLFGWLVRLRDE